MSCSMTQSNASVEAQTMIQIRPGWSLSDGPSTNDERCESVEVSITVNSDFFFCGNVIFANCANRHTRGYPEISGQIEYLFHALPYFYENFTS